MAKTSIAPIGFEPLTWDGLLANVWKLRELDWLRVARPALALTVVGVAVSILAWWATGRWWDRPVAERQLELLAQNRRLAIQDAMLDFDQMIDTTSGAVDASSAFDSASAFAGVAEAMRQKFRNAGSIAWAPRAGQGGERGRCFPVRYLSGDPYGVLVPGTDLCDGSGLRAAIEAASKSGCRLWLLRSESKGPDGAQPSSASPRLCRRLAATESGSAP